MQCSSQPSPTVEKPWYKKIDWTTTLFLALTPLATLLLLPHHIVHQGWSWALFAFFLVYTYVCGMSITGGYHRLIAHRSYEAKPWVHMLYLLFGAGAFQGSALKWCSDHRIHHRHVDTENDPYNINEGFWYAHIGWLFKNPGDGWRKNIPIDLSRDKMIMWQDRHYVLISIAMGFGFPTLIGALMGDAFGGLVYGGLLRVVVTHHCTFFINSLCHMWGFRPYNDKTSARDNFLLAFFTFGEGYHNYHHHFQADYRNGIRWYHWDPTKWLVAIMSWLGWTSRLKVVNPQEILKAKLAVQEGRSIQRGAHAEKLQALRHEIEMAQQKLRDLYREYETRKANARAQSQEYLRQLRAEMKAARGELRSALARWSAYTKAPQGFQAT